MSMLKKFSDAPLSSQCTAAVRNLKLQYTAVRNFEPQFILRYSILLLLLHTYYCSILQCSLATGAPAWLKLELATPVPIKFFRPYFMDNIL